MPSDAPATLRVAARLEDIELARGLFVEYAHWLKVDLCFQGFERELATLPGAYAPPFGRLGLRNRCCVPGLGARRRPQAIERRRRREGGRG